MAKKRATRTKPTVGKLPPLSDQLKDVLVNGGVTRYRIAKDTGVSEQTISKFVNGHQLIGLGTVDILGQYLGLRLVSDHPQVKGGK
ncbi:MAG: helix-turn-helix transcriptional regulator [Pirellulales bacterium]